MEVKRRKLEKKSISEEIYPGVLVEKISGKVEVIRKNGKHERA